MNVLILYRFSLGALFPNVHYALGYLWRGKESERMSNVHDL